MIIQRATPESAGIPSEKIFEVVENLKKLDSLNSIMILRHGKCCFEAWWKPFAPEIPHILFSLSKSFTSSAIGYARSEGKLTLSDKLVKFFPECDHVIRDSRMRDVTLRDLLTMRSGHHACCSGQVLGTEDWVRSYLSTKLDCAPGTYFAYNSMATYMLAAVVKKVTGQNVREYLMPRLFVPLGVEPGPWECCPKGINKGGWGFYLKTEDIAKFAQLLLQKGKLGSKQIYPADYLAEATVKQSDNSRNESPDWKTGYGYQFWVSRHGYRGDGASGQYAIVLPEEDMAIAVTSGVGDMQRILTVFWEILLPSLSAAPLPENPEGAAALERIRETLEIPVISGDLAKRVPDAEFRFKENFAGIRSAAVHCGTDDCSLTFRFADREETIRAGFGFRIDNTLTLTDIMPRRTMASAAWRDGLLVFDLCGYETSFRDRFTVDFKPSGQPVAFEGRFGTFRAPFPALFRE